MEVVGLSDGEGGGGGSSDRRELVRESDRSREESRREELADVPSTLPLPLDSVAEERLEGDRKGEEVRGAPEVGWVVVIEEEGGKTRPATTGLG